MTRLYRLPLTTAARPVVDLARTLPLTEGLARTLSLTEGVVTADSALHQEKATRPELLEVPRAGENWPGARRARQVVEFADERAEPPLEDAPELQATVHTPGAAARADFLWRERKVIAEADGLAKYNGRDDLLAQFARDRLLRDAGYQVIHFTWQELFATPGVVIARIRAALAGRGAW